MVSHSDKTRILDWCKLIVLAALVTMLALVSVASPAQAASMNLDIERGAHRAHISTEEHRAYLTYDVKASGDTSLFCDGYGISGPCSTLAASDDAHTVTYTVETTWQSYDEYNRPSRSGLPSRTVGAINGKTSRTQDAIRGDNWYWTRREGPLPPREERPLVATMTLVSSEADADIGTNKTLQWVVNPEIVILTQGIAATEGTDTHMEFPVSLRPTPLETVTVDYTTKDLTATAGSDYTATSGTLTFSPGETTKTVRVPITDDMINDNGELLAVEFTNPTGAARLITLGGDGTAQAKVEALGQINNDEPGPDPSTDSLPLVTITVESGWVAEGSDAVFKLTRTGNTDDALTVTLAVVETGAMLADSLPTSATFTAGKSETELRVSTVGDEADEADSTLTVTLASGEGYRLGTNNQSEASATILDDDAKELPGGTAAVAGTTIWTADMTVEDYGNGSIGAGTATLIANQRGTEDHQAKWLYYHTDERKLRMAFTEGVSTTGLTLKTHGVDLLFPNGSSGNSSFTWDDIDVNWTDEQTFETRLVRGEVKAKPAPDPTLKKLTIPDGTLSTSFETNTVLYEAAVTAGTETVTISAETSDADASVAYDPAEDADATEDNHQVAVPAGQSLVSITVTSPDGDAQRTYRILFTRPPTVAVSFGIASYTATEGGDAASVTVELSADPKRDVSIPLTASPGGGATAGDYTVAESVVFTAHGPLSKTVDVAAVSDDDSENGESVSLSFGTLPDGVSAQGITSATVTLEDVPAEAVNTAPTGLPTITGTPQVNETLTASVSGITDADGTDNSTFIHQWISNNGTSDSDIDDATGSTYTPVQADVGSTIKVRVTFTDDAGTEETLVSAATDAVAAATPTVSISGGSGTEGDDASISFTVTLDAAASATVTVDYATSDGSATAGDDYTAKSGTLSFAAGETSKTISVAVKDDTLNESDETFTVTLSNASGANPGTTSATGTIQNRYVAPLTATFSNVPPSHSGSGEFTFDLAFSENFPLSYATLRDHAFTEDDNGPVTRAQRKVQGSNQTWTITIEPKGNGAITITLPATTDCAATGAICTDDGRKLSNSTTVTVPGPE